MIGMARPEAFGDQALNGLAEQLHLCVTEQLGGMRIRSADYAVAVRNKNRVGRNIEQILQRRLSNLGLVEFGPSRCCLF